MEAVPCTLARNKLWDAGASPGCALGSKLPALVAVGCCFPPLGSRWGIGSSGGLRLVGFGWQGAALTWPDQGCDVKCFNTDFKMPALTSCSAKTSLPEQHCGGFGAFPTC